ncbi:DUF3102 domain-containing protein [Acinetobacter nosocomialis]|uniref:DUF3102 domain-containing protein n=1 Tax=Acinetobacter nosocomialis TaxID=106654 RepID=A0A836MLK0_ACINO|nr:DUF3102 domain-containing protein [Acinetobacter nosocomialis]KDM57179.1 hypothetical protein AE32_01290 [Acinetobacter nosocomialis]MBU3117099.1 DUF3102 domain-containing protein [Acinetobacter nosocomialis]
MKTWQSNEVITEVEIQNHTKAVAGLATQLGYEGALTVGALEDEIRFFQQRTVEAVMELGKRLLILKEITPHGEFNKRVEMLNFTPRMAQKFMSAVLKFSKTNSSSLLQKAGNQTKLLELVTLDEDEIQVIDQGGSIGELSLDTIETMSVRELKDELRKIKADKEASDLLLQKKDQKLNELDAKLTKLQSPVEIKKRAETEEQALEKAALETLNTASITFLNALMRYQNDVNSVLDTAEKKGIPQLFERVDEAVIATYQRIAQYSRSLNVQIDFTSMVTPEWMSLQAADLPPIEVDGEA